MLLSRLVAKNAFRHKLRTTLTVVGIVVAITAFGLLRTIVDAWYAGANASSSARLITRSSVSLVFSLPVTYAQKIRPCWSVIAFVAYFALLKRVGAGTTSYVSIAQPVIALGLFTLFEGYRWTPIAAVGLVLAVLGNGLALRTAAAARSR
jgi:drug/metabolite transporter (DMT)-like permease